MEEDFAAVTPKVEMTCEDYLSSIALTPEQVFAAVMQDRANTLDVFDHVPITPNSYGSHVAFFPNGELNPKFWTPDYFLWAATDLEMVKVQMIDSFSAAINKIVMKGKRIASSSIPFSTTLWEALVPSDYKLIKKGRAYQLCKIDIPNINRMPLLYHCRKKVENTHNLNGISYPMMFGDIW